ncbi:MAG: hypothetical protein ACM3O8_08375 [Methylococcaceae bacterium]|nr:hypothetical protein [Prolixibacteraceae bacterium]
METKELDIQDRVRENTSESENEEIDQQTLLNVEFYGSLSHRDITRRLEELRNEWDIEKLLEVNAAAFALTGLVLGKLVHRGWYMLPGIVASFLFQHGIQGWCPPLPLFRAMGYRTRQEISEEVYALKVLRGDFEGISAASRPKEIIETFRN